MAGDRFEVVRAVAMPSDDITRLSTLAQTKVLAQRGKYGESNLYESLAEIDKSLGLLKDIFERASRIQDGIFKSSKATSRLRSLSNHAAGIYLLTRYGFGPLVQDVVGILKALDKPLGQMLKSTRAKEEWSSQQTATLPDFVDAGTAVFGRTKTTTHKVTVRALSLDNVNITPLGRLGLGVKDFISVPWELASYSFVYDWFANLGDYLGAMVPDIGLSNVGGCVTVEWECVETVTYSGRSASANGGVSILSITPPPPFTRTIKYKSRTPGLNPGLSWQSDFKFDKLTRCLDALALFSAGLAKVRNPNVFQPRPAKPESREVGKVDQRAGVRSAFDYFN